MSSQLAKWDKLPVYWVNNETTLYQLIDKIDNSQIVALDTEFIRRSTYYPILALIQINTGDAIYLVDAPQLFLHDLWQALIEVPMMVWYACFEDLWIFYLLAGCPPLTNIFDVQIAIAYLTGQTHVGYSQATHDFLDVCLNKSESKSDWMARPLSNQQEQYAVNDVRYLLALYHDVKKRLDQRQLYTCVIEDSNLLAKDIHATYHTPLDKMYLNYISCSYKPRQLAILRNLVAWREALAKSINQPVSFIINKQALREIVEKSPLTIKNLAQTTLNRHTLRRYGNEILKQINHAKSLPESQLPQHTLPSFYYNNKNFKNAIDNIVKQYSQKTGIPECLLLKSRWIDELTSLVYYDLPIANLRIGLQGYRYDWVVCEILPLLMTHKKQIQIRFES